MWNLSPRFAKLGSDFFSYTNPTALTDNPRLIHLNHELIKKLDLTQTTESEWLAIISGQTPVTNYLPLASVYMGHQFGVPVPQLGDGRALLIAEHVANDGQIWEMQLKGAGKTPYSRFADGRAVLRSSIREYLASQALNKLGIPTTLAGGIITSDDAVYRENAEPAAIVLRAAPSFLRFGHFEYFARHNKLSQLQQLSEFCCCHYFPTIDVKSPDFISDFLEQVCARTARLIAHWQAVGFVHGVMNTDNMSILGLTIDYGPFSFMDKFAPEQIFNHSDSEGRYVYARQPMIAWWNLYRLADALVKLYPHPEKLESILAKYADYYNRDYLELMTAKLGLSTANSETDLPLIDELLPLLQQSQVDWTWFWRRLSDGSSGRLQIAAQYPHLDLNNWYQKLDQRYQQEPLTAAQRREQMLAHNPAIILRSHLLQSAIIRAEAGDHGELAKLFTVISSPYQEFPEFADYYRLPPAWATQISLSCSS